MNSEQLRLFIAGAFGSEEEAREILKLLRPSLRDTLQRILASVENLPDESLRRQMVWREMLPEIELLLTPYNDEFARTLSTELPKDGMRAAIETLDQLKSVGIPIVAGELEAAAVMADSTKFLLRTKVNERRVLGLFVPDDAGASPFTKSARRAIDQLVTGGIIRGEETKVIAAKLIPYLNKQFASQALAIARTAIQDYNRQVKETVWQNNMEAIEAGGLQYEWVSALDSLTCQTCAPLDGKVESKRGNFPKTPVHVNCRCDVVLIDPNDKGRIRYGQEAYDEQQTGEGAYKTKRKVKGKNLFRKKVKVKTVDGQSPRYADFIANANEKTQQMFFGSKRRAEKFRAAIKSGKSPQQALVDLTKRVDSKAPRNTERGVARKFTPVKD